MKNAKQISPDTESMGVTANFFNSSVGIGLLVFGIGFIVLGIVPIGLGLKTIGLGIFCLLIAAFLLFSDIRNLMIIKWLKKNGKVITAEISYVREFARAFEKAKGKIGYKRFCRLTCFIVKESTNEKTIYNSEERFKKKYLAYSNYTVPIYIHPENEIVYFVDVKNAKEKVS